MNKQICFPPNRPPTSKGKDHSPDVIVYPDENVVHEEPAWLAGTGAEGGDEGEEGPHLLLLQMTQHPLHNLQCCQLGRLVSVEGGGGGEEGWNSTLQMLIVES